MKNKKTLEKEMRKALQCENEGNFSAAFACFNNALNRHTENRLTILFEMGCFLFRTGQYAEALDSMIQCHKGGYNSNEIENIVMEAYYTPNIEEFAGQYHQNTSLLKDYEGCEISNFPMFKNLTYKFIPFSEKKYAIFDGDKKKFTTLIDFSSQTLDIDFDSKQSYMIKNEYNIANLTMLENQTRQDHANSFSTTQMPIFCVYENKAAFIEQLQILPLAPLLEKNRVVFLFGRQEAIEYFNRETAVFPNLFINMGKHDVYYKAIEAAKLTKLKTEGIHYQNLMQLFSASFDTPKAT